MYQPLLVIACILFFCGSIINKESASTLLSGYNTLSDEKKKKVNFACIAKLYQNVFYIIATTFALICVADYFYPQHLKLYQSLAIFAFCWGLASLFVFGKKHDQNVYPKWHKILNISFFWLLILGSLALIIYLNIFE